MIIAKLYSVVLASIGIKLESVVVQIRYESLIVLDSQSIS